eukprot:Skav227639  [mRNA]  locus=scaffold58:108894:117499:+ [translate_table: standard]
MAAALMQRFGVDACVVGADRVVANGAGAARRRALLIETGRCDPPSGRPWDRCVDAWHNEDFDVAAFVPKKKQKVQSEAAALRRYSTELNTWRRDVLSACGPSAATWSLGEHADDGRYALAKAAAEKVDESSTILLTAAGDIFCALAAGASLVLAPRVQLLQGLSEVLRRSEATHVCATPALWHLVEEGPKRFANLRCLSLGGEKMTLKLVEDWASAVQLRNIYGVTEATVYQTAMVMSPGTAPQTAGRPLPGVSVAVLPWPDDHNGEICLAGPGIARGYLDPDLTADRFCTIDCKERCYRTGDSGCWIEGIEGPGRILQVLGRRDLQVKLNGERIELGEVEHMLNSSPLVRQCAVMPWGQGNLLAYVLLEGGEILDGVAYLCLTAHCDKHLPRVMRPRRFVALEALPMNPNGKIDRSALSALQPGETHQQTCHDGHDGIDTEVSLTNLEKAIVLAWTSELSLSQKLGPDADFYSLGGGSVQAVRVTRVLRAVLHGGGGGAKWAEGRSDWRNPAGDASLFMQPEKAGDAECHFGLCDGGPFAPCALLERPILRQYAQFLAKSGVRTSQEEKDSDMASEPSEAEAVLPRALESAIRSNREVLAHALLMAGVSATGGLLARHPGTTPLHWASMKCSGNMVHILVSYGASVAPTVPTGPRHPTEHGALPGHVAAAAGNSSALRSLLEAKAPARSRDKAKQSLLHFAVRSGDVAWPIGTGASPTGDTADFSCNR